MDFILNDINSELLRKGETYLRIKVRPGAAKTAVRGTLETEEGQTIKIDVAAPPERGRANEELLKYLARELLINKSSISIISGVGEKIKLIKIRSTKS